MRGEKHRIIGKKRPQIRFNVRTDLFIERETIGANSSFWHKVPSIIDVLSIGLFGTQLIFTGGYTKEPWLSYTAGALSVASSFCNVFRVVLKDEKLTTFQVKLRNVLGAVLNSATPIAYVVVICSEGLVKKEGWLSDGANLVYSIFFVAEDLISTSIYVWPGENNTHDVRKRQWKARDIIIEAKSCYGIRDMVGTIVTGMVDIFIAGKLLSELPFLTMDSGAYYLTLITAIVNLLNITFAPYLFISNFSVSDFSEDFKVYLHNLFKHKKWEIGLNLIPSGLLSWAAITAWLTEPAMPEVACMLCENCILSVNSTTVSCKNFSNYPSLVTELKSMPSLATRYNRHHSFIWFLSSRFIGKAAPFLIWFGLTAAKGINLFFEWRCNPNLNSDGNMLQRYIKKPYQIICCDPISGKFSLMRTINNLIYIGYDVGLFLLACNMWNDEVLHIDAVDYSYDNKLDCPLELSSQTIAADGCALAMVKDFLKLILMKTVINASLELAMTACGFGINFIGNAGKLIKHCLWPDSAPPTPLGSPGPEAYQLVNDSNRYAAAVLQNNSFFGGGNNLYNDDGAGVGSDHDEEEALRPLIQH